MGRHRKSIQDMKETPKLDRARLIVRPLLLDRRHFTTRDLSNQYDISHVIFETAVHCERARFDAIQEVLFNADDGSPLATLTKEAATKITMISIHTLIEKLCPLFARVKDQSTRHVAALSKSELAIIAFEGQRLLDEWASDDVTVRRVRGHVVPPKNAAIKEEDDDASSLPADLQRDS
jgi:hypothetical protein